MVTNAENDVSSIEGYLGFWVHYFGRPMCVLNFPVQVAATLAIERVVLVLPRRKQILDR